MKVEPAATLVGDLAVPGVKGICQRGVLLGAVADGESELRGFGHAADTDAAIDVARALGAEIAEPADDVVRVRGAGLRSLRKPDAPLDCGNAGTVMRLVAGLLAGQEGRSFELVGDESLSGRPQERIAVPLREMGARVETTDGHAPLQLEIPGDFSSAAPFVAAATLLSGSGLRIHGVNLNPTRTGFLDVLARMGARIAVFNRRRAGGEPVGDLEVRSAELVATEIGPEEVPRLVDELPLFALVAGCAHGSSAVRGARELRVKETNRIETVTNALRALGIRIRAGEDGFGVRGIPSRPKGGGRVDAAGDHRIAMLGAIAGLVSREAVEVEGAEAVAISFPGFFELLDSVTQR